MTGCGEDFALMPTEEIYLIFGQKKLKSIKKDVDR